MRDYHESVTTGQTDRQTDRRTRTDRQTDAGQSDPYVPLCFAGNTQTRINQYIICFNFVPFKCYIHITNINSLSKADE